PARCPPCSCCRSSLTHVSLLWLPPIQKYRGEQTPSCSLLVQHGLVETVAGDLLQEIADQPCRAVLAHRPRGLTQRLQHAIAEWQRFVWQRQVGALRRRPAFTQRYAALTAQYHQGAEGDAVHRGDLSLGRTLKQRRWNTREHVVGYP